MGYAPRWPAPARWPRRAPISSRSGARPHGPALRFPSGKKFAGSCPLSARWRSGCRSPWRSTPTSPEVAQRAVEAGAILINDISGLTDMRMAEVAAASGAALVVMNIRGRPKVRQVAPHYDSVVDEVYAFLEARTEAARRAGVPAGRLIVDPGFSFGKAPQHDLEILGRLGEFRDSVTQSTWPRPARTTSAISWHCR